MPEKVKDLKLRVPIIGGSLGRGRIEAVASPVYSMSMTNLTPETRKFSDSIGVMRGQGRERSRS